MKVIVGILLIVLIIAIVVLLSFVSFLLWYEVKQICDEQMERSNDAE